MRAKDQEDEAILAVALQNARSILQARQRAEEELLQAKEALERKTQELAGSLAMMRATLESTADGILVTDGSGLVTVYNQRLVEMWSIPPQVLEPGAPQGVMQFTSRHLAKPDQYLGRIETIYRSGPEESFELLELLDGRVFERFSRRQVIDGRNIGRVWSFRDISERRRTEETLARQSERHRITLSSIGDAVITTDPAGRVTSLNPVAEQLTGWASVEAHGKPLAQVFRIINEESREPVENPALRALQERRVVGLANHTLLIAKDGTERAIDDSAAPIMDGQESVVGVVLIFRDVGRQRLAEEARLHLAAVVDSSDDAIVSKTLDGIIRSWNGGAKRIFGYTAEEAIGKPITMLLPQDQHHEEGEILRRLRRGERIDHFETLRIHKDGRPICVSVTVSPIRDASGHIIGASKIARDITRRKRTEETTRFLADASAALAEVSDYRGMLQQVASMAVSSFADGCAIDLLEPDGTVRRAALAHAGLAGGQAEAGPVSPLLPLGADLHPIATVLQTGRPEWTERLIDSPGPESTGEDIRRRLLRRLGLRSFLCVPLRARTRTIGALTFVTAQSGHSYGIDDLRAVEDLAHRVVIALENANLLAALQESDQRKDEFLAMLAHELRNPLAPIRNAVQILRMTVKPARELQWATEVIERQVSQMTRLVDDLLDVSRITSGKIQLHRERIDLAAVIASAIDASRLLIDSAGHQLTVALPPEPIYLDADVTRLSQVLLNLLNNAAKYTDHGGRIWLTVKREGGDAVISVRDTGIGIAPEMLTLVFDMFAQADRSLERSQGGLGLGLTLVKRLVDLHGGSVRALSAGPDQGSEFVVRLPISGEDRGASGTDRNSDAQPGIAAKRVLVTDDNRDAADSLAMMLRMLGQEVRTAYDGEEAVDISEQFRPELVLLDIGLPRINGYEAARQIRETLGNGVILIAVTGWGKEEDRRLSREAGFDHHFTKPVDLEALHKVLAIP